MSFLIEIYIQYNFWKELVLFFHLYLHPNFTSFHIFSSDRLIFSEFFFKKRCSYKSRIESNSASIILQEIYLGSCNITQHLTNIPLCMYSFDNCRTELVILRSTHNEFYAFFILSPIYTHAYKSRIVFPSMLDIHCNIINNIFFDKKVEHIWILSISVYLHKESSFFNSSAETWEISVNRWLSSTNRDTIKYIFSSFEKIEENPLRNLRRFMCHNLIWNNHLRIMTETASEIASGCKYNGSKFSWIIYESTLLEPRKYHKKK